MKTVVRVVVISAVGLVAGAWASAQVPAPREPSPPARLVAPSELPTQFMAEGRGSEAANALELARERLPFAVALPVLPAGYSAAHCRVTTFGDGKGFIDMLFLGVGKAQFQLFESNYAPDKPVIAPTSDQQTVILSGRSWDYRLLSYPQPDGSRLLIHSITNWDGQRYVSLALHSTGAVASERASLLEIAASLR